MKKTIFNSLIVATSFSFHVFSQTVEPSASITKSYLQLEFESIYTIQKEGSKKIKSWSMPASLFRYGLINGIELQLNIPIIKEQLYEYNHLIHSLHKFDDIQVGVSVNLWKQFKILPEAAFMLRAVLPKNNNYKLNNFGKILSLNLSNYIANGFSFNYNIGYVLETNKNSTAYFIANISFKLNSKIHLFIENFGDFTKKEFISNNINTGIGYNINEAVCLDISVSKGINHHIFYTGGVLSWSFKTSN